MKLPRVYIPLYGLALLLLLGFGGVGCAKKNPLDDVVTARNPAGLLQWKADVASDFTPAEWHDFDEAFEELKLDVMSSGEATGGDAISAAACQRVDGKKVRDVLQTAFAMRLSRLVEDRDQLAAMSKKNGDFHPNAADTAFAERVADTYARQQHRLQILDDQIAEAKEVIQRRGLVISPPAPAAAPATPKPKTT